MKKIIIELLFLFAVYTLINGLVFAVAFNDLPRWFRWMCVTNEVMQNQIGLIGFDHVPFLAEQLNSKDFQDDKRKESERILTAAGLAANQVELLGIPAEIKSATVFELRNVSTLFPFPEIEPKIRTFFSFPEIRPDAGRLFYFPEIKIKSDSEEKFIFWNDDFAYDPESSTASWLTCLRNVLVQSILVGFFLCFSQKIFLKKKILKRAMMMMILFNLWGIHWFILAIDLPYGNIGTRYLSFYETNEITSYVKELRQNVNLSETLKDATNSGLFSAAFSGDKKGFCGKKDIFPVDFIRIDYDCFTYLFYGPELTVDRLMTMNPLMQYHKIGTDLYSGYYHSSSWKVKQIYFYVALGILIYLVGNSFMVYWWVAENRQSSPVK